MYHFNYKFWLATTGDIEDFILRNDAYKKLKPITDETQAHEIFANLYARYVGLVNNLSYLYDQIGQVQKREIIKTLLEASTKRLLELRKELKKLEFSEFIYFDKMLIQKKLIPQDVQLLHPYYFPMGRNTEIQKLIDSAEIYQKPSMKTDDDVSLKDDQDQNRSTTKKTIKDNIESKKSNIKGRKNIKSLLRDKSEASILISPEKQSIIDSVNLIKSHDRARKARILFNNIKLFPYIFKPTITAITSSLKCVFTHKPEAEMLIPINRTHFDVDDFYLTPIERTETRHNYNFYVSPHKRHQSRKPKKKKTQKEELSPTQVQNVKEVLNGVDDDNVSELKTDDFTENVEESENSESVSVVEESEPSDKNVKVENNGNFEEKSETNETSQRKGFAPIRKDVFDISPSDENANIVARKIQSYWRMYKAKKQLASLKLKRLMVCGMIREPKKKIDKSSITEREDKQRHKIPWLNEQFRKLCEDEKTRIIKVKGPWIMEDISDHIRGWFREFYDQTRDFHPYPEETKGGTILLLRGETMTVDEFKENRNKKIKKTETKNKEKENKGAKGKKAKEMKGGEERIFSFDEDNNENFALLKKTMETYKNEWKFVDEANNTIEEPYIEWIREDKYAEVHQELRAIIDNLMRIEYELLRKALAKDNKKKYKPRKKKKSKRRGKKKQKQKKDMTIDRTTESLFNELIEANVIEKYQKRSFNELVGDYNYAACEMKNIFNLNPKPARGDIKDLLREWLLGMGPLNLPTPKSICIVGPSRSGKKTVAEIIATEIGAVVFNLNPEIVVQFKDNMKYFIHLITKMSKILQPTIIKIDQVHRVFWKKVPKDQDYLKPKLIAKYLIKQIVKPIKIEDKILVLGLTDTPWQAKFKQMKKCFEKILTLPKPDYGSTFLLWNKTVSSIYGIPKDFEFSALAKVTNNYKYNDTIENIEKTCNLRRRMKFQQKPLKPNEFIETFLQDPANFPLQDKDFEKYVKFFEKIDASWKKKTKNVKDNKKNKK